jgi:beta-glucosidase
MRFQAAWLAAVLASLCIQSTPVAFAQLPSSRQLSALPWSDPSLSPDRRADLVMQRMTLEEKLGLVHGAGMTQLGPGDPSIARSNGGAGFVPGIPRLGLPDLNMSDSAVGIANTGQEGRYATALPSALALASSWNEKLALEYGSLIGAELADQGFNVSLGGGVNLARDPRDGRIFEFLGEDPILAGNMDARIVEGIQSHHIIGDVKHFAVNDQETGRDSADAIIGQQALRETDLLAFRIAIRDAHPGMVMCAYNLVNGIYSCQNRYLLEGVLKGDWGFKGWVISDWGGTHSTVWGALAGLDMEMPGGRYFGKDLAQAVESGRVPMARLNDMVHRILRTEFAAGIIDHPNRRAVPDIFRGFAIAQRVEEESAVLLKNSGVLPLDPDRVTSIAIIGSHADVAVLSGGGSSQVNPPGGNAVRDTSRSGAQMDLLVRTSIWDPSSPLRAIKAHARTARVTYDPGLDVASAAATAEAAQVAIVFVHQHMTEGFDARSLQLPGGQNQLVAAVAAANPRTIVVLETGGPVAMPWVGQVAGILEAWYPGIRGGPAIANLLFGTANPSGKLAITFPRSDYQLPHPAIPAPPRPQTPLEVILRTGPPFDVRYTEGLDVGYKWFDTRNLQPLFPFGYGLSYSKFAYSSLTTIMRSGKLYVRFSLRNVSSRAGAEIAEIYLSFPDNSGEPPKRLVGWTRVGVNTGESKTVSLTIDPLYLSVFDTRSDRWRIHPGLYKVLVGPSSRNLPLSASLRLQ